MKELAHRPAVELPTPKNYKEAIAGEFAKFWKQAIQNELDNLKSHQVFSWVPLPPGQRVIDSNWA